MNSMEATYRDALLTGDLSGAIERSEKREQRDAVRNERLPIKSNDYEVPREIRDIGITDDMDWETSSKITKTNIANWTKEQYEKMGIKLIKEYDDLFYTAELPEGWTVQATDHSMWNNVIDDNGRKRISFFYKGAFYDRDAFSNFERRFSYAEVPFDNYLTNASYEERKAREWYGVVRDGSEEIFRTEPLVGKEYGDKTLKNQCTDFLNANYPGWENHLNYWDKE